MNKIIKDPLVHFLLLGLVLFLIYNKVNDQNFEQDKIIIDSNEVKQLVAKWDMQWKRPPTEEELTNIIIQDLRQEVFYKEALKMNLDHNDEIIKRRLSQKMQFLSNDLATLSQPSEEDLDKYYKEHSPKYRSPYIYTLYQIVFTNDNHKNPVEKANTIFKNERNLSFEQMRSKGDNLPIPYYFENVTSHELAGQIGVKFSENLTTVKENSWYGPVNSGFGEHLVYVIERKEPTLPRLQDVKSEVLRDFQYDKQIELKEAIFQSLKKNYDIVIDVSDSDYSENFKRQLEDQINN
ncbi:peptidylprolyl isomerase [uncultured Algibacter sp.]|uniref:peptidylprolyl isomerase n=1 Tax=uncultured Algibacter sp. TaxID=298659 RepID=UPI0026019ED6|nr:peptidylprolyl isomerase [uncultured Algibacter sp.]